MDKDSIVRKGNTKMLIRNLSKQSEKDKEVLALSNVSGSFCQCEGMYCNIEIEKNECWLCGLPLPKQTDR